MALSKSEVEKYISKIEGRLNSPHERNLKGLAFAELYRKAGELELAKRYTLAYISTNSNDYRGHKFLGELLEDGQDYHKALESYKRSFAINNDQSDVLLEIVKLYTELKTDPEIAKAWADHASKRMPGHSAIFDLQVHLIELKGPLDYDELINLIAEELTQRPHDSSVHAKLVETYMEMDHVEDAYDHCVSVNKTKAFHKNLPWFVLTVGVLERYLNLKETQVRNHSPMSRQSILQEIYIALLTSYCNMVDLNLTQSTLRKSSTSLLRLDQLLYQAINLDNGLSNSTDLSEASEWDVAITEVRAQLYMLSGHLLLRLAKEGYSAWSQALEMATACYVTSYRVSEPEMTSSWVAKASSERNPVMWSIIAASRLSQTGHLILSTLDRYGEEKINSILLNLCSPQGQEDILTTLYGHNNDFSKLFLSEDESFLTPEFIMPEQLMKYDEVFIAENPLNLELIVWIGLQWYQHGQETEPGKNLAAKFPCEEYLTEVMSQDFEQLRMAVATFAQSEAEKKPTFALWLNYIDMVQVLLIFLRATRENNWDQHLSAVRSMLPWFFATDRVHYARYGSVYWLEMFCLETSHPGATNDILENWTCQRQKNHGFSSTACDQVMEQTYNRDSKVRGGLVGFTLNRNAVHRWIMAQADRGAITRQCLTMTDNSSETRTRKDMDATQTKYHEQEVANVVETITNMSNPFEVEDSMINIASGKVATTDVSRDMNCAKDIGEQKCKTFISEQLLSEEPDLFATLKATKLSTFSTMDKKAKVKTSKGQIVELKNDLKFISRLLAVGKARDVDMKEVLTYSLRKFPSPLSTVDGQLVKTPKAKLLHILEGRVEDSAIDQLPPNNALILDGMALIQTIKRIPETFGALVEVITNRILSSAASSKSTRVDFVCDTYPDVSIKNLERSKRAETGSTMIMILGPQQKVPRQFKKFLSLGKNKEALIEFIFQHLKAVEGLSTALGDMELFVSHGKLCHQVSTTSQGEILIEECAELYSDHEEADTRLLLHAKHAAAVHDHVIIRSPDTDVFILMLGHKPAIPAAMYFDTGVGNQRRILDLSRIHETLGSDLCDALIGFHAFTVEILVSQLFDGLRMDVHDVTQCAADFVCLRDVEAFIYAVIKCSAHGIFEDLDVVYEYYQPKLLPLCLCQSLCIPTQTDWWNAVYTLFTGTVSVSSSGKVKMTVQRGLEQIRTLKNQGMHPKLVIHLATNFGQKSLLLKDAAGYSQWYYSTHWKSFQLRSLHYWNVALSLFEDMKRNKNPGCPKDPLFPHNLSHLEDHDIHRYFREACMTLGEAAVERGDLEHALNLFSRVESSHAAWNEAQIFKHLAGLESSNADVDDRAYESYIQYLNEAKDRLLLCLERLEYDKVVRDAVEEELAGIESLMNERKSFYHVDPRKSIDFHQLDFDALKSPVCSDITESGETMPLKENDTRELLATVSEVTLDNGFLREQVSIRDEQVLRLSRQVQELQSKLARYKDGDTSPASFSCPSERTPSPLEDYESPTVHLETGEKFTRQGTFINNIVVPTDRYDDPSFFSGLSNSNTPERIQTVLDGDQEDESEEETDDEDIYFEPVVQLPSQVEFRSGEEDETVIFEERTKLFRFQDGEWKERGLGNLKLLWNNTTGQARILMRREKVLKICANHFLTQGMTLKAGKGSDRSWVWSTLADISDDETKPEQFAAKFQTKEIAEKFKSKFEELQQKKASFVPESPAVSPFAANPLATKPSPDHMQMPVLSSNLPYLSSTPNKPAGALMFTKAGLQSFADSGQSVETPFPSATIAGASQKSSGVADAANFWNQPHIFPGSPNMPYFQSYKSLDNSKDPQPFQASHLGSEQPLASAAFPSNGLTSSLHPQNTFSFSFGSKPEASASLGNEKISSTPNEASKNEDASGSRNGGIFGDASEKGGFQDLASSNAFTSPATSGTGFTGFGKPIFSVPDNDREEENDIENEANIDFKPIVSLPLVKNQATGEEGELIKFSERAKLFRFDPASKEWKERGLGEIKLLYDPSSGNSRVVMRREQIHKLCANHFIHPSMKLKANTTSNRSWLWYTHADVSDGEPKGEQLAVKFKQEETASEFKKVFEELQSISPTSKASDPDADQDTSTNMSVAPSSQSTELPSQFNNDLKLQFQLPTGSWSCDTCLVQNSPQSTQCVACQTPKPGFSKQTQQPTFSFAPPSGFSFGSPAPGEVPTSSQANDSEKPGFSSGFGPPSFSFGSQAPKDKAPESDTPKSSLNSGFSFGSGKTLPNEFTFGEQKADKPPFAFSFPKSNNDASQRSTTSNALTNNENNKFVPTFSEAPVKETSLKGLFTQPSLPANNLKLAFQPAEGSWECDTCLVRNTPESSVCVACQTPKPGTQPAVTNPGFNFNTGTSSGFSFGASDATKAPAVTNNLKLAFQPAEGSWECDTCLVRNTPESNVCVACQTPKPGTQPTVTNPGFNFNTGTSSGFSFGGSDTSKAPAVTNNLKLAFQPAEGSWECDTCLVRNTPESSVCVACQTPKPGVQPAVTHTAPNFNTDTPSGISFGPQEPTKGSGFSFGPSDTSKLSSAGTGFTFAPTDKSKDQNSGTGFTFGPSDICKGTEFSFGYEDGSKDPTKGPNFSFVPDDPNKNQSLRTGFSFGPSEESKDTANKDSTKATGFNFGPIDTNKDQSSGTGPKDGNLGKGPNFNFGPSSANKDSTKEIGFSFGPSDASIDSNKTLGFTSDPNTTNKDSDKEPPSLSTDAANIEQSRATSFDDGDTDSEETTESDYDSEASEEYSINSHEATREDSFLKLPTPGSTDLSEKDLRLILKHPVGSWECETCLIQNTADVVRCVACEAPKPSAGISGENAPSRRLNDDSSSGKEVDSTCFTFQDNSSYPTTGNDDLRQKFQAPEGSWDCGVCMVRNDKQSNSCVACQTPKPGQTKQSLDSNIFGQSFPNRGGFSPSATTESTPNAGFTFGKPLSGGFMFGNGPKDRQPFGFNFGAPTNEKAGSSGFSFGSTPQTEDTDKSGPTFGDSKGESSKPVLSFGGLGNANKGFTFGSTASDQSGFNFSDGQTNQPGFNFSNSGDDTSGDGLHLENKKPIDKSTVTKKGEVDSEDLLKLGDATNLLSQGAFTFHLDIPKEPTMTSPSNKDLNVNEDNPEAEDERAVFKPIVSLPSQVDVKTGEEDETTLFSSHAKLYRFTQSTWKERGVGDIKILYDPTGKRGRIIMRRDQVHIVCANHFISKDMKLQPQGSSDKSWLWHVQGDFADNETKEQLLAVKFGDTDTALAFKRAFEECLDNKVSLLDEGVVDDEVIVVYEVSVTEEQRGRAAKFLLPSNFYAYENQNEAAPEQKQDIQETLSVVPAKPAPQSFVFGSADITSLSFNALASGLGSNPAFSKSSPNKEFTGAGSQLFVQENNQEDDDPEREVSGIGFKPIVQLEKIEQSSGEENEIIIYTQRTKLYRYDKDTAQWKERGVGNLKLLKHKITGQVRVLMRRDQIFKVCANHFLTADMELKVNAGSDRSWLWHTNADVSDGEPKAEQLAVRFKNAEIAQEFKEKFDMCKEELASATASEGRNEDNQGPSSSLRLEDAKEHSINVDATARNDALDTFPKTQEAKSASPGNIDNTTDDTLDNKGFPSNVGANETEKESITFGIDKEQQREASQSPDETSSTLDDEQTGTKVDEDSERKQLLAGLKSLPLSSSSKTPSKDSPPEQAKGPSSSQRKTRTSSSSARSPPREILSSIDQPSPSTEPVMRVNFNFHSIVAGKAIYTGLEEEKINPPETVKDADKTEVVKQLFPDTEDKNIGETELTVEKEDKEPQGDAESSSVVDGGGPVFTFGSSDISAPSFASLANQSCGFTSKPGENKGFLGSCEQLFSSNDEDDPEREVEGTDFKPIVSLPDNTEQKTGEEDETVVYTKRAKLFRYDLDTKQWKERGVGDIKILLHNETKRCRVVMRREQIHKLCANHYIAAGMELKENAGSDRSWVWSVDADFADGVAKNELLAVRFKHREDAVMFRDKFIECQEKNEMEASESTSVEEKPSNDVDEVVIIFEKVPSPEQKERAQLHELPQTFYCSEQDSGDEVEKTCDEDDAVDVTTQSQESVPEKDDIVPENEENSPIFQFGSKETSTLSFAELAQQTSGFPKTSEGTWKGFLGSGEQLFTSNDEDDPEREVEGTDFKPIVSLPDNTEQKTGEEDETVVYTHRAKLFRYDLDTKQWKERGVGNIKILLHNETKRCRVVMRREQIHKLCANHYITAGMELKENAGSDRSWVWSVDADFADGVAKNELLAVRFKHREDAVMFRDKFIECQEKNEMEASESTSVEVVIIFEKVPSPEQKERAQLYELPQTFYCFEQDSRDEVEKTCDEDDAVDVTTQSQESVPEKDDIVPENEENTPIFQFGSKETSTLSFAELAQQTSGFLKTSEGTWKGFLGSGEQLFSSNDEDDPEREVEGTDFKPIVSLPDITEQKTGEEDETVVYTHRAKLFRYDSDTKQWKERGVGDIKILLHNKTKRCRVVMRRDQIHKLCANHYITAGMELKENAGSDRSWVWSVDADFADGVAKNELLAVRFKHREDAVMFRDKFIECQDKNEMKASESTSVEEKPSNGVDEVVIIFEKVPSPEQKERAQLYELPQTFYCSEETADVMLVESDIQEKSKEQDTGNVSESFQDKEEGQRYSNDESSVQSQDFITPPESYPEEAKSANKPRYKLNVVDESPSNVPDDSIPTLQDSASTTTYAHSFVFGSQDISSLSFSALAGKTSGFKSSPNKEFTGVGSQLFVQENNQENDDPEREVSGIDFRPIVQLEKIEQSSGEENEIIIYTQRTKLYRYDKDTAQWKERGVGNLKLLKHKITGQVRVLMRRDQIFKVCANHFLTADMELKANAGSDRSWLWHTNADVSDGEPKAEQLAVRFKNAEIAQEFKERFDMCKEELKASLSETKNIQRDDDDNVDEKQSVHETKLGAFRVTANDHSDTTRTSMLNVTLKKEKLDLPITAEPYSSSVAGNEDVADKPERELQKSEGIQGNEKKLLVTLHTKETRQISSPISRFYTEYLPRLAKQDLEESNHDIQALFSRDAEVYFFDEQQDDWRERGYGTLQILRYNNEYHIFMADQARICVAHQITPSMDLKPNAGSDRSWVWFTLADHSDVEVVLRELAAEFQSVEHSFEFKKIFDQCRDSCGVPHEGHVHAMAASFDSNTHKLPSHHGMIPLAEGFDSHKLPSHHGMIPLVEGFDSHKPPSHDVTPLKAEAGLWCICTSCKVENSVENTSCLVCGKHFTAGDIPVVESIKPEIEIKPSSARKFKKPIPTPKHIVAREPTVKQEKYKPVTHWWKCMACGVENNMENSHCLVCSSPKPPKILSCSPEITAMLDEISKK